MSKSYHSSTISQRKLLQVLLYFSIFSFSILIYRFFSHSLPSTARDMSDSKSNKIKIAYYITGHGLGHATRSLELIRGLLQTGKFSVHTVTTVDESFFINELKQYGITLSNEGETGEVLYKNWYRNLDTGGIQKDVIHLDPKKSLETYYNTIHLHRNELLEIEVNWAKEQQIDLILMDSTQFATAIAKRLGIKSIFVTNFTWNYIFEEMLKIVENELTPDLITQYQQMIEVCKQDVLNVDYLIRYPGGTPLPTEFDLKKIIDGPVITRPIRNKHLRKDLGISETQKVLVLGFGGHAADWNLQDSFLPEGWICLVLRADKNSMPSERFQVLPHDIYVPDVIYAADAVLGKIGYGFVSECLGGGAALIYIPRVHWPEEAYLEDVLTNRYHAGVKLPLVDYNSGNWRPYIEEALAKHRSWTIEPEKHPDHATEIVVQHITRIVEM